MIVWFVWQILGRGIFAPPIREQPWKGPYRIGLKISVVNVIKSAISYQFCHIY